MPPTSPASAASPRDGAAPLAGPAPRPYHRGASALILAGIVLLAFNLRPAAVSVGPVLAEVRAALGLGPLAAGLLTTLPVVAFSWVGAVAPALSSRFGPHRVTLAALLLVALGLGGRAATTHASVFLALSFLALAGMATANVILPSLVKLHFPERIGLVTAVYTTALAVGLTLALVLTVPVAQAVGTSGWRSGLAVWAVLAAASTLPWWWLIGHDSTARRHRNPDRSIGWADIARTPTGWIMAAFFGLQSMQAYAAFGWFAQLFRDSGFTETEAGVLVGILAAVSIPASPLVSWLAGRHLDQRVLVVVLVGFYALGYLGLGIFRADWAWLWALLIGIGTGCFPLVLTMIGLRAHTPAGTAALSGFIQSTGYLIAIAGPFGVGLLYDATGGWDVPIAVLGVLLVPQLVLGLLAARPRFVEDELVGH